MASSTTPEAPASGPLSSSGPKETKAEKFGRIAPRRVQATLDALDRFAQCCNKAGYEWTPEQAGRILDVLTGRINALQDLLEAKLVKKEQFTL